MVKMKSLKNSLDTPHKRASFFLTTIIVIVALIIGIVSAVVQLEAHQKKVSCIATRECTDIQFDMIDIYDMPELRVKLRTI